MKIKESSQLKPGDVIEWDIPPIRSLNGIYASKTLKKANIQVMEVYTHHVLFRILEPPYLKLDIQNVQLYQKGIYKTLDLVNPFVRCEDE